jgi:peroxiredoxin
MLFRTAFHYCRCSFVAGHIPEIAKMKTHRKLLLGLAAAGGCLCIVVCAALGGLLIISPSVYNAILSESSLAVGDPAPDFQLETLAGETITLSQFRGQPVLLSLSATWCPGCREEAPVLQKLHERQSGLVILSIDSKEGAQTVQEFADEFGLTYPIALDQDGAVSQAYRVWATPTNLLIDENGVVRARIIDSITEEKLAAMLEKAGITP